METHAINATPRVTSWGAITGGVITVLAISILLSVLGAALGFTMVDPYADQPAEGVGTAVTIWSFISILISLAFGGFVAGRLAGGAGISHGFLVWATSLIIAIIISSLVIGGALRMAGNIVGSIASATGSMASGVVSTLANNSGNLKNLMNGSLNHLMLDTGLPPDQTPQNIVRALQNSQIDALQPDYLSKQLMAAKDDVQSAISAIMKNPDSLDNEMDQLTDKLKQRSDSLAAGIKRDDVHQALASNTAMTPEQVDQATDSVMRNTQRMTAEVNQRLEALEQNVAQAKNDMQQWKEQAKEKADAAAKAIAKSTLWSFIALLIGALVGAACGLWGARTAYKYSF
jgi:uncharacterized protein YoxC